MAIKTTLQTLSDNKIKTNATPILKTEHAEVNDAFLDEFYADTVLEEYTLGTDDTAITTPALVGKYYELKFKKQGGKVTVTGYINNTLGMMSNTKWFDIVAGEFTPEAGLFTFYATTYNGTVIQCGISGTEFRVITTIASSARADVNFTYYTLN